MLKQTKGGFNIMRYGAGPSGPMRTLGQYMLGSGLTFGYVGIGACTSLRLAQPSESNSVLITIPFGQLLHVNRHCNPHRRQFIISGRGIRTSQTATYDTAQKTCKDTGMRRRGTLSFLVVYEKKKSNSSCDLAVHPFQSINYRLPVPLLPWIS